MKRYFFILVILILCGKSAAQIDLSASMGLDLKASPSLRIILTPISHHRVTYIPHLKVPLASRAKLIIPCKKIFN